MAKQEIDTTEEAATQMSVLIGAIKGKRNFLEENDTSPWNRQRIQSNIGKMEERLAELEREWPEAAQRIS